MDENTENDEAEQSLEIPLPEDVLDPTKLYTRTDIFDFSEKGNLEV